MNGDTSNSSLRGGTGKAGIQGYNQNQSDMEEFLAIHKKKAIAKNKKRNIFDQKRGNRDSEIGGSEHWILSDMGSDTQSIGGDSCASFKSFTKPKFNAGAALMKKYNL